MINSEITTQLKINYCCHALRLQYPRCFSRGWRAFCATATGGKVLLPSTRPYLIYVGLDMRPGLHVVSTLYYPHSPLSVTLSTYSLYQDMHRLRIGQSELTCMLVDDFGIRYAEHTASRGNWKTRFVFIFQFGWQGIYNIKQLIHTK